MPKKEKRIIQFNIKSGPRAPVPNKGFETIEKVKGERRLRIRLLEESLNGRLLPQEKTAVRILIKKLMTCTNAYPCNMLACPACMRRFRKDIIPATKVYYWGRYDVFFLTLMPEQWRVPHNKLRTMTASKVKREFLGALDDCGMGSAEIVGFVHAEYDDIEREYRFHIHAAVAGFSKERWEYLRQEHFVGSKATKVYRPMQLDNVLNPAAQFSYAFKGFWERASRWIDNEGKDQAATGRIRNPHFARHLIWLSKRAKKHLLVLNGVKLIGKSKLKAIKANPI